MPWSGLKVRPYLHNPASSPCRPMPVQMAGNILYHLQIAAGTVVLAGSLLCARQQTSDMAAKRLCHPAYG